MGRIKTFTSSASRILTATIGGGNKRSTSTTLQPDLEILAEKIANGTNTPEELIEHDRIMRLLPSERRFPLEE